MRHRHYYLFFAFIALAGLLAALNLGSAIGQPFGGFFAGHNHSYDQWVVEASTPPWWPPIVNSQLHYDDTLAAIDGQPYDNSAAMYYQAAQSAGRQFVTLNLVRDNQPITLQIPIQTFSLGNFLDLKLPDLINGLGFWLLAITVFAAQPHNAVNRIFALAMSCTAGAIWLSISGLFVEAPGPTSWLSLLWIPLACLVGLSFIHLTTQFPVPARQSLTRFLKFGYGLMVLIAIVYAVTAVLLFQSLSSALIVGLFNFCNFIVIGSFGLGVVVFLIRLAYLLARPGLSRRLRRQTAILLIGAALTTPYVLVIVVRALIRSSQPYFALGLDLRYLALATPIAFAFIILRYQTLQRVHPMVATTFILATSALLASLATWLMRLIEPQWMNTLTVSPFVPLFLIALSTATFYSLQNTLRGAFTRFFQWELRSYTAVRKFTQQVIAQPYTARIPAALANALVEKLELDCASVWVIDASQHNYKLEGKAGRWPASLPDQLPQASPPLTRPRRLNFEPETLPRALNIFAESGIVEVVAPLIVGGQHLGLLALGKRWDEDIFDDRDLDIIELVAQEAALFILTARQVEELREVPQQITAAQERERFRIAQELHDTVQQFLGRLPFYLEVGLKQTRTHPAETEAILKRTIAEVEAAAQTVRQIRANLAPLQLETSLSAPLQTLIQNFEARTGVATQTDFAPNLDSLLDLDSRHALYRVFQQALDNIAAHAHATQVTVTLTLRDQHLHFTIADNGHGADPLQIKKAETRGSFGLLSMRARLTTLGGEFNFASMPTGTTLDGWLPLPANTQ